MSKNFFYQILIILIIAIGLLVLGPKGSRLYEEYTVQRQNRETMEEIKESSIIRPTYESEAYEASEDLSPSIAEVISSPQEVAKILSPQPTEAYLEVPFICQAPLQTVENWVFHEESCEEAALLQAYLYITGQEVSKEEANEIILDMISWQEINMQGHHDLYADDMKKFIMGYYSLSESQVRIVRDAEIADIKKEILSGKAIIAPITGEILQNPYYPYPGYHMLTIIGFTEDRIITNDNGTRNGADFSYDIDVFEEAYKDAAGDLIILENL